MDSKVHPPYSDIPVAEPMRREIKTLRSQLSHFIDRWTVMFTLPYSDIPVAEPMRRERKALRSQLSHFIDRWTVMSTLPYGAATFLSLSRCEEKEKRCAPSFHTSSTGGQECPPSLPFRMDLFPADPATNLLPHDGTVNYFGPILSATDSADIYQTLLNNIPWSHDEVVIFGKRIVTAREVAWFGDAGLSYRYSGTTKHPEPWTPELIKLKKLAEHLSDCSFNSCLLNLYHNGGEGMGWHSDDEKSIVRDSAIASISLGAEREFRLKHKRTDDKVSVVLESGSLLVMKDSTQRHWLHSIPKTKRVTTPRINLTFRCMVTDSEK